MVPRGAASCREQEDRRGGYAKPLKQTENRRVLSDLYSKSFYPL
jgi:hypothetical protein